jgi:SAM-dependent methyltransferase
MHSPTSKLPAAYQLKLKILAGLERSVAPGATILDFGCGAGLAVRELRSWGFDAYGFDVQEKKEPDTDPSDLIDKGIIRVCTDETAPLPFPEGMFDVVLSYQVFEHVHDYSHSISELARIMKPDGVSLHVFPARLRPFEAHVGIPFASVFPHVWWLNFWAALGYRMPHQRQFSRTEVTQRNRRFLMNKTHYVSGREIKNHFQAYFREFEFAEKEFLCLSGRIGPLASMVRALPGLATLFGTFWTRVVVAAAPVIPSGSSEAQKAGRQIS